MSEEETERQRKEMERIVENLLNVKYKIVVMSGKGGVGKSTVSVNLALELALRDYRVGLLDADITGPDVPKLLALENERPGIAEGRIIPVSYPLGTGVKVMSMGFLIQEDNPVIWRGPMKMGIIHRFLGEVDWGVLDFLVIDLPPGTSDEPLSLAQYLSFTGFALIVTTPQELALLDVVKSINFAKKLHLNILGVVENMSGFLCPHCGNSIDLFKKGGGKEVAKRLGIPFLGRLEFDPEIVRGGDEGKPFALEEGPTKKSFADIVDKIDRRIQEERF